MAVLFRLSHLTVPVAALAVVTLSGAAQAAQTPLEGVWELAVPQTRLQPADGGPIPFTAQGRARYRAHRAAAAKGDFAFDATKTLCASPGQPRLMLAGKPFALFVRPRMVTILYAWNRLSRQIAVGPAYVNPTLGGKWWGFGLKQGHAVGEWKGDSFLVQTDSFLEDGLLDDVLPAGNQLKLTERLRQTGPDLLEDRITINDPQHYARTWDVVLTFKRSRQTLPFAEHVCFDELRAKSPGIGG